MVTLFRADSPRTPMRRFRAGTRKRENAPRTSGLVPIRAGARGRTGGLPFTRRRDVVPETIAFAGVVSRVPHFRRSHNTAQTPVMSDSGAPERNQAGHADSQRTPRGGHGHGCGQAKGCMER